MKVIGIGRNYTDHAKELSNPVPAEPIFFLMPDTCLLKNNQHFYYPDFTKNLHYELEVVIKLARVGKHISQKFAHRYYKEFALGIDFTARDIQDNCKEKGLPWEKSKAFDNSCPISDFMPIEDIVSIHRLDFNLDINGKTVQKGNTADMIFKIDYLISYISQFITLKMGDLIFTGTPAGVGPVKIGDNLQAYANGIKMMDFLVK